MVRRRAALGFDGGLKKPPTDALRPIIPDNACILCIIAAVGTELANAYSPDTVIASSPGKEVHDPWAFYLHAALLRQAFAHCGKFPTAASCRSLGRVSVPVWLIITLVLTRYSPVRHWKHHFLSDLHVLSMPPAFILSQDRTLHEIHSCITYSFLVRRQSHLANKPVYIEVPQAVLPVTVFEAVVRIPYNTQLKQVLANGK
ncbi:hypothetical protein E3N88_29701 [Mikania micrantha]|uniref:Cytochrome f large domain-containing protein n=1 Tax=Mikania micrantha TaxID=192012 RepID=A0A5N6MK53_9ASTR|nr:hypothetical protein E3N88_29701 [Mikania micrantha]